MAVLIDNIDIDNFNFSNFIIEVTASSDDLPIEYSLDNINFQLSNVFIVPNNVKTSWTVYVKDAALNKKSKQVFSSKCTIWANKNNFVRWASYTNLVIDNGKVVEVGNEDNFTDMPQGGIIIHGGTLESFTSEGLGLGEMWGMAICNGNYGTPDMRSMFAVGYDPLDIDYDTIGNTGGEKEHILTESEMPSHSHNFDMVYLNTPGVDEGATSNDDTGSDISSSLVGGGLPHENRPPYYTAIYLMKL